MQKKAQTKTGEQYFYNHIEIAVENRENQKYRKYTD